MRLHLHHAFAQDKLEWRHPLVFVLAVRCEAGSALTGLGMLWLKVLQETLIHGSAQLPKFRKWIPSVTSRLSLWCEHTYRTKMGLALSDTQMCFTAHGVFLA